MWAFVLDLPPQSRAVRLLLIRRSADTVTCPKAWALMGEHNAPNEHWGAAARRGIEEELGLNPRQLSRVRRLGGPLLFLSDYSRDGGAALGEHVPRKVDAQATALYYAVVRGGAAALSNASNASLSVDDVESMRWVRPSQLLAELDAKPERFCNAKVIALLRLATERLLAAHKWESSDASAPSRSAWAAFWAMATRSGRGGEAAAGSLSESLTWWDWLVLAAMGCAACAALAMLAGCLLPILHGGGADGTLRGAVGVLLPPPPTAWTMASSTESTYES